jgi:hypothetical protein
MLLTIIIIIIYYYYYYIVNLRVRANLLNFILQIDD